MTYSYAYLPVTKATWQEIFDKLTDAGYGHQIHARGEEITIDMFGIGLVAEGERPKIVCLCGSTRYANEFMAAQFRETVEGNVVLTVGCFPRKEDGTWDRMQITDEQKVKLDALHFRKIEMADEVLILNVGGYIGESTQNELNHARQLKKVIRFLEPMALNIAADALDEFQRVMEEETIPQIQRNIQERAELAHEARTRGPLGVSSVDAAMRIIHEEEQIKTIENGREVFMVHKNSGNAIFVKTYEFFRQQGGFKEEWGKAWVPVVAEDIEKARAMAEKQLGGRSAP